MLTIIFLHLFVLSFSEYLLTLICSLICLHLFVLSFSEYLFIRTEYMWFSHVW
jgi:hypothetical protein